jgi:hypothetical protein
MSAVAGRVLRRSPRDLILPGRASTPDVVEWELERGEKTEPKTAGMPEPELASAPDRGLGAQPVPVPDRGLDGLAVRGWSVDHETPALHALEAVAPARVAAKSTTNS